MKKIPEFFLGLKQLIKKKGNTSVQKIINLKNSIKNFNHKKTAILILITCFIILSGVFIPKIIANYMEPNVIITTDNQKSEINYESPAQKAKPEVQGTTTMPEEKNTEEKIEKKVEEKSDKNEEIKTKEASITLYKPINAEATREYGFSYSETFQDYRFHSGIDYKAPIGTNVTAAADGKIEAVEFDKKYGYKIIINHSSGWKTVYCNIGDVKVEKGQNVKCKSIIAAVAVPGEMESEHGPHLHFEVIYQKENKNPQDFIKNESS
jgi:murein DD-endopeptidase MepM/ murein hydrolase activator NlpD